MPAMTPGARPGAAKVELSDARGDTLEAGRARVRLKLSAIAWAHSQAGLDTGAGVQRAALGMLVEAGVRYWEAIMNRKYEGDRSLERTDILKVAAHAYAGARHGVDANVEICRAGLGALCEAAIRFCEDNAHP